MLCIDLASLPEMVVVLGKLSKDVVFTVLLVDLLHDVWVS